MNSLASKLILLSLFVLCGIWPVSVGAQRDRVDSPTFAQNWRFTDLTAKERAWLAEREQLVLGVGSRFVPIMYVTGQGDKARFRGMVSDYVKILEHLLGVPMKVRMDLDFRKALALAREGKVDMFPCVAETPERRDLLLYTRPYLKFPLMIITRKSHPAITGMDDLRGQRVAVVKHLATYGRLKADHPWMRFRFCPDIVSCLQAVADRQADAYIVNLAPALFYMQSPALSDLKMAAPTPYAPNELAMGVRRDLPILKEILQKALDAIPPAEHAAIRARWLAMSPRQAPTLGDLWAMGWKYLVVGLLALGLIVAWNLQLRRREARFRGLTEHGRDLTVAFRPDGAITYHSPSFHTVLGYHPGELDKGMLQDLLPPEERAQLRPLVEELIGSGSPLVWEHRLNTRAGHPRIFETNLINLLDDPSVRAIVMNGRDISDRRRAQEALRESEARYRSIFTSMADGLLVLDEDNRVVELNQAAAVMFGYRQPDMLGMLVSELLSPGEGDWRAVFEQAAAGDRRASASFLCLKADGGGLNVEARPSLISLGGRMHRLLILRDVTARNAAQEALSQWAHLFENVQWGVGMAQAPANRLSLMNPAFAAMLGHSLGELRGREIIELAAEDAREPLREALAQAQDQGEFHGRTVLLKKDGQPLPVRLDLSSVKDGRGRPLYCVVNAQDITPQLDSEREARDNEARYRLLTELSPEAIILHRQSRVIFANPGAARLFGAESPQDLVGLAMESLVHPDERPLFRERTETVLNLDRVSPTVYRWQRLDGATIQVEAIGSHISQLGQDTVMTVLRDVTERVEAEREKALLEERLRQSQKMEAIGTLAGGIAHDFNNILGGIVGYAELALADNQDLAVAGYIKQSLDSAERARELIKRILDFSRPDAADKRPLDLNQAMADGAEILSRTLPKMVDIVTSPGQEPALVLADLNQLEQVLLNLGANANDAMPEGGRLSLATGRAILDEAFCQAHPGARPGEYAWLSVSDTGQGMTREMIGHIFDPFFTTKGRGKGTGLGLFTVFGIVKNHDGVIDCVSSPEDGTSFTIYLPAVSEPPAQPEEPAAPEEEQAGGAETILLVDDDQALRHSCREMLARKGYRVISAASGEEALTRFEDPESQVDLVVLDMGMPGMGGFKCLDRLLELSPKIRVLVASGYADSAQLEEALRKSEAAFLAKPFRSAELLSAVRALLDQER